MPWESRPGCRSDVGLNRLGFTPCAHRLCAAQTNVRAHTSSCTCTNVLAPRQRSPEPSQRSIRAGISLIFVAHVASRPPTSALTVQEQVMTLAHAHARLREEHFAPTKPYGVCLERVSPDGSRRPGSQRRPRALLRRVHRHSRSQQPVSIHRHSTRTALRNRGVPRVSFP